MATIGLLTGGGDCPGLNPVIRAVVRKALLEGYEIVGIKNGWKGLVENDTMPLNLGAVSGILPKGGTILGTSRTNPYKKEGELQKARDNFKKIGLDALVAVGGEDTLGVAFKLTKDGLPNIVGVPKTIDNDLSATDYTFGFDTALNVAMECIDRLHTTAESHHRIIVAEVMGRHAGWIAIEAGIAGGADSMSDVPITVTEAFRRIILESQTKKTPEEQMMTIGQVRLADMIPPPMALAEAYTGLTMGEHTELMVKEWVKVWEMHIRFPTLKIKGLVDSI